MQPINNRVQAVPFVSTWRSVAQRWRTQFGSAQTRGVSRIEAKHKRSSLCGLSPSHPKHSCAVVWLGSGNGCKAFSSCPSTGTSNHALTNNHGAPETQGIDTAVFPYTRRSGRPPFIFPGLVMFWADAGVDILPYKGAAQSRRHRAVVCRNS